MATINRITGTGVPQAPGQISTQAAGLPGRAQADLGDAIANTGKEFFDKAKGAIQTSTYSTAITSATEQFTEAQNKRMERTTDENGNPSFSTLSDDLGNIGTSIADNIANGIVDPQVASKFRANFSSFVSGKRIGAMNVARNQQLEFSRTEVAQSIEGLKEQAIGDIGSLPLYANEVSQILDSSLSGGLITSKEHGEMMNIFRKEVTMESVRREIYDNPAEAKRQLESGTLPLKEPERRKLIKEAEAGIRDVERGIAKAAAVDKAQIKQRRQIVNAELDLGIAQGTVGEAEVEQQRENISEVQFTSRMKQLIAKNKAEMKSIETMEGISADLNQGKGLFNYTTKEVNTHYGLAVKNAKDQLGKDLTMAQKAEVATRYPAPIGTISREAAHNLTVGDEQASADAFRAIELLSTKQPLVIANMDSKARAVHAVASTLVNGTNIGDAEAIRIARKQVLETDDVIQDERAKEYRAIPEFSNKQIFDTVESLYNADSTFGFGGEDLEAGLVERTQRLLRIAYQETGNMDSAIKKVQKETKHVVMETEFNGGDVIMFKPPEALFPGDSVENLQADFQRTIAAIDAGPEGINPDDVRISATDLTQAIPGKVFYAMHTVGPNGEKIPVKNAAGEQQLWEVGVDTPGSKKHVEALIEEEEQKIATAEGQLVAAEKRETRAQDTEDRAEAVSRLKAGKLNVRFTEEQRKTAVEPITRAAGVVGGDVNELLAIAKAESTFRSGVKNKDSSATGLFQFIKSTWAAMVKKHGAKHGISIDDIRDPRANAIMGAILTKENKASLRKTLGRPPTLRETYLAHFAGVGKAKRVLRQLQRNPNVHVSTIFTPREIRQNPLNLKGSLGASFKRLTDKVVKQLIDKKGQ